MPECKNRLVLVRELCAVDEQGTSGRTFIFIGVESDTANYVSESVVGRAYPKPVQKTLIVLAMWLASQHFSLRLDPSTHSTSPKAAKH